MSATAGRAARRPGLSVAVALAGTVLVLTALAAAWLAPPGDADFFAFRAAQPTAPTPGTDATLLLSGALALPRAEALWAASWFGAPVMLVAGLVTGRRRPALGAAIGLGACLNPLALGAYAGGWGLAAPGVFLLAAQLAALPERSHHRGLTLLGAGVAAGALAVPGSASLALPLFAVLFLAVPRPWAAGAMRATYLTAFTPPAACLVTLAYLGWQSGAAAPAPLPSGGEDAWHLALGAGLAASCAPGLAARALAQPAGLAVLGLSALAFVAPGVPDGLAPLIAWSGQAAWTARRGDAGAALALAAGTLGALAGAHLLLMDG